MRRKLIIVGAGLLVSAVLAAWFAYTPLRERQLLRRLAAGDEAAVESVQQRIENCPPGDTRLIGRIADSFAEFTPSGQLGALRLCDAANAAPETARIVQAGLTAADSAVRLRAVALAAHPSRNLAGDALPLLADPVADVRRATLKAFSNNRDVFSDESLLPLLHDADDDLRARAEATLRARGLRDKDIQIGRLVSDPSPLKRSEVIRHLPTDADLDPEVWLQKLCDDPSPTVRANAACAAMDPTSPLGVNFTERVRRMAQRDPDGTVRQIADYLIRTQR